MPMAQTLEVPMLGHELNMDDQRILHTLENGELPIEQVVALSDVEQSKTLSSVARLIAAGYLRLVIIAHLWGVEFVLRPTGWTTAHPPGKYD